MEFGTMMSYLRLVRVLGLVGAIGALVLAQPGFAENLVMYRIRATSEVSVSLPLEHVSAPTPMLRREGGTWEPLEFSVVEGGIRVTAPADGSGGALLLLHCPAGIDRTDTTPPAVVRFVVDGVDHGAVESVSLGSVLTPPRLLEIEVRDELNAIRESSVRVSAAGRSYSAGDPQCRFTEVPPRGAILSLDLEAMLEQSTDVAPTISVTVDDRALDEAVTRCTLSFRHVPPHELADGRVLRVDSVTTSPGWREWWVITDGVTMDDSLSSARGYTWLSEESGDPHWVVMQFPAPVQVAGVRLWWGYYQQYRTSRQYDVQVRTPAGAWETLTAVRDQAEAQFSEHRFAAVSTDAVRIWQPAMGGQSGRAGYMWLAEFEVIEAE